MKIDLFVIPDSASIKEALRKISENHGGFILTVDSDGKIIGLATDGDIRSGLLKGINIESPICSIVNRDFYFGREDTPHELLLKQLDSKIKFIPILDNNNKLISILTKDHLPEKAEVRTFYRAKSPVRISFGGGGSDISSYFNDYGGAVINATISIYTHATLRIRDDEKITIHSRDLNESGEFSDLSDFLLHTGNFSLIKAVINAIKPTFGFELFLHSDFPMNSGLGGSSVVSAAILGCFNQLRNDKWDKHELSEMAFQAERIHLGIAGGWQDQYATVFGGLNFMEFNNAQNIIHPIRIPKQVLLELEESLILCYTGTTHDSGNIHDDQAEQTKSSTVKEKIQSNVNLTYEMRNHLLRGRLTEFGYCLNKAWEIKRGLSSKISTPWLDEIYARAIKSGVIGGKLLGAGGGGYFLFYVPPFLRHQVMDWIKEEGLVYTPFIFEENGLQAWTVREKLIN
jgi:D-glycero-alpha-D-manno-heptose-7-phosphate kinase